MKRALIVDDCPDSRFLLGTMLREAGWGVEEAADGAEAFAAARRNPPDLIVSDLLMPVMDGFALLRHCKADDRLRHVPVAVLTETYSSPSDEALARRLGASAFCLKRTADAALLRTFAEAVENAREPSPSEPAGDDLWRDQTDALARKLNAKCLELAVATQESRAAEARLHQTLAVLPAAAYTCDAQGLITYCNELAVNVWGRRPKLHDPSDRYCGSFRLFRPDGVTPVPHDRCWMALALQGEPRNGCEILIERADGSRRLALAHAHPLRDEAGRVTGGVNVLVDITERQQAEHSLRESEERFRQVTENIGEVFWLCEVEPYRVIYVSPAFAKIWGRTPESLLHDVTVFFNSIHPDDVARVQEAQQQTARGEQNSVEYRIRRPDGSIRWIRDRGVPVRNAQGHIYRVAGVAEDVTSVRQLEEQYLQAQKMEAIGQLAGGIAHDFNNLLTVIQMHGSLLLQRGDARIAEGLRPIMESAERAANLTRQLLTFSRRQVKEARPVDLGTTVTNLVRLLRRLLGEDIALETRLAPNLPFVSADNSMIEQVIMNLAVNARDAMPEGGCLSIAAEPITIGPDYIASHTHGSLGDFVCLTVSDTGAGISADHLPHIFEPFFTTKEAGKGTGLGLATVFSVAQQHGGWVDVTSALGKGSTFRVFLPAIAAAPASVTAPPEPALPRGSERILLVEDEATLRAVTAAGLRRLGYRVAAAASAGEALQLWREDKAYDLLLTDLIMPGGITGRQLAGILRNLDPRLRVIYMSGYSDEIVNRVLTVKPGTDFLPKPFEHQALATIVRQALDAPPAALRAS